MSLLDPIVPRPASAADFADAVERYDTPLGRYLGAKLDQGWWSSQGGQLVEQATLPPLATAELEGDPEFTTRLLEERMGPGLAYEGKVPPPERRTENEAVEEYLQKRGIAYLTQDAWTASPWFREGVPFEPFMTEARARAKADVHDSNAYRNWLIEQRRNGVIGAVLGFGAAMVGGLADPINFVGLGWATRAVMTAKAAGGGARSILRAAGLGAAESAVLTATTEPVLAAQLGYWGDDLTWADAILDIAIGAATGGVISAGGAGLRVRTLRRQAAAEREAFEALDAAGEIAARAPEPGRQPVPIRTIHEGLDGLNIAVGDLAAHRAVDVPPPPRASDAPDGLAAMARRQFLADEPPADYFVHGRTRRTGLETGTVIQATQAWSVARRHAGADGTVWALRPREDAKVVDLRDETVRAGIAERLVADAEAGRLSAAAEADVMRAVRMYGREGAAERFADELNPRDIVDTAGFHDNEALTEWFSESYAPDAARTDNGLIAYNLDRIETVRADVIEAPDLSHAGPDPGLRTLDEVDRPEPERPLTDEEDPDVQAYREQEAAGAVHADEARAFEEADAEVRRMADIEKAYQVAGACILRTGG